MQKYMVYMDDGHNCFKLAVPAIDEKSARDYVSGNGEVICIKNITDDCPISLDKVYDALKVSGFGEFETDFILRTLSQTNIAE